MRLPIEHMQSIMIPVSLKKERDRERQRETERVKNGNKNITHIDPKQSTPLHKNADNASTKENADNRKARNRFTSIQKARNRL